MRSAARVGLLAALLGAVLAGCAHRDPAQSAAERFVDAYYVEIDLPRARDEAAGLARSKVEEQLRLVAGQPSLDPASRPSVHYRFLERQSEPMHDRRGYLFELTITLDREQVTRRALVTVAEAGGAWHAVNFQELD